MVMIITGGSRGIGAALARRAAARGYPVCVNYMHSSTRAESVVSDIRAEGGQAIAVQADVADRGAVERMFARSEKDLGPTSVVVNNAAYVGPTTELSDIDDDVLRRTFDTNLIGAINCMRCSVDRMSIKGSGPGGSIVNVSSTAALHGAGGQAVVYAASKGGLETLTVGMARELADQGIRVNAVRPGLIDTEIHDSLGIRDRVELLSAQVPMRRAGTPDEVASAILWLASDEASYVTGAIVDVAGGR